MNVEIVSQDKGHADVHLDSITIAEIMRVYLVENGADFAAWRREHPSKPVIFKIQSEKGVGKAVIAAVGALKKDLDSMRAALKK